MFSQGNFNSYNDIGQFDSRIYLNMLEINGVKAQSNLFATDNQFSQLKKIAVLDQYEEDDDNQSAES